MNTPARHPATSKRRAGALVTVVVLLSAVNLAVVATLHGGADASERDTLGVETTRAFYAAESAARIALGELAAGRGSPATESVVGLGVASMGFGARLDAGEAGEVEVVGLSGRAQRRLAIEVE